MKNRQARLSGPPRELGLELISEAYVVHAPECVVADPTRWTIEPYEAVGTLGCANNANIAMMVSDPKDLLRPRALEGADGTASNLAVQKYQTVIRKT